MVKLRPDALILGSMTMLLASVTILMAQQPVVISVGNVTVEACSGRLNVPIFMANPYPVGGFNFAFRCTDPSWLSFSVGPDQSNWDTVGSIISNWEAVGSNVQTASPGTIRITAIADVPGGRDSVFLPPQPGGLLLTLHPRLSFDICADTSQLLLLENAGVSDPTGYILYPDTLISDYVYLLPGPCADAPRGDANCSHTLNGIDAVFMVAYFKGLGRSYCCLCTGDVNANGAVNGIDITYLVSYLKGQVVPPVPCN